MLISLQIYSEADSDPDSKAPPANVSTYKPNLISLSLGR